MNLSNTILFNSTLGTAVASKGYNLSNQAEGGDTGQGPGGRLNATGDRRNTNPLFDAAGLASNGGPTQTIGLQANSPPH